MELDKFVYLHNAFPSSYNLTAKSQFHCSFYLKQIQFRTYNLITLCLVFGK